MLDIGLDLLVFFIKIIILVAAFLIIVGGSISLASKGKDKQKGKLHIKNMNEQFDEVTNELNEEILSKRELKKTNKAKKKQEKTKENKRRIFTLTFDGDIKASGVNALREEITAILSIANTKDEVVIRLTSPGGVIHGYGLAASQLARIKEHNIPLTVAIDTVAASGGYMMACVADKIIAAPFSIIGSIGAVIQMPNFNKWLKKHNIDFEQLTAGEHKRTLTMFGENNDKGREKMQEELEEAHDLFKDFIRHNRPQVDLNQVATGEHWFAKRAIELQLVDELQTSDDYLFDARNEADIYHLEYTTKKGLLDRVGKKVSALVQ
jgi:serine protease SohB